MPPRDWDEDLGRKAVDRVSPAVEAATAAVRDEASRAIGGLLGMLARGTEAAASGAVSAGLERLTAALEVSSGRYSETTTEAVRAALGSILEAMRAVQPSVTVEAAVVDLSPVARAIGGVSPTVVVDLDGVVAAVDALAKAQAETLRELRMIREAVQASAVLAAQPRHYSVRYADDKLVGVTSTVGG